MDDPDSDAFPEKAILWFDRNPVDWAQAISFRASLRLLPIATADRAIVIRLSNMKDKW